MKRIKLTVSYDGTAYCGWQKQKNGVSVEAVLNDALSALLGKETAVIGASRTDAGVHALGNVAVFDTDARMPAEKFAYALNTRLPADIRIQASEEVDADFHPRYRGSIKTYEYRIYQGPFAQPLLRTNTYFFHRKLAIEKMRAAAKFLEGEHDFAAFCSAHAQVRETTRTIYHTSLTEEPDENGHGRLLRFRISGNGFLYNMVRIIVGTLLDVGEGRYAPEHVKELLDGGHREDAGPCAPANGLTLLTISYEDAPADELHVFNERMHYSLVQKDIAAKKEAYLTVFFCREDLLGDLLARMAKKSFRLGAKHFYARHEAPETAGGYFIGESFSIDGRRYVSDHEVRQMDRDLRADPPRENPAAENAPQDKNASTILPGYTLQPVTEADVSVLVALYNKCFFSQPCTYTLSDADGARLAAHRDNAADAIDAFLLYAQPRSGTDGKPQAVGFLLLSEALWDEDAVCIAAVGIDGPHRRKGLCSALLDFAAQRAVLAEKKRLTLAVSAKNKKAVTCYVKNGFYDIRALRRWYRTDSR